MATKNVEIVYGALAPKITEQLAAQSLPIDAKRAEILQRDYTAVERLRIRGLLTDSESARARARLQKAIVAAVVEAAKAAVSQEQPRV